ncbi:MAG: flagellar biosynthetic protein FliR [Burkholderiales bacterium]|nr:flagellar biosynthetic protein FliR [Burkholderiales bacterium]
MITFSAAQLEQWLAALLWPLTRVLALLAAAPVLGQTRLPVPVRIGLALAVVAALAPSLPAQPPVAPASAAGMLVLATQIVIGLAMGFALRLVFVAVEMAGDLIGLQMGLGFAMFYDPGNIQHTPILGQFMSLLATLVFLAINGHLLIISALAESFHTLPIAAQPPGASFFQVLARHGAIVFVTGLQLALPLIVTMLVVNLALGVLTRSAPQLNIFAVGFPVTLAIGFGALILTLPYFGPLFERTLDQALRFVLQLPTR